MMTFLVAKATWTKRPGYPLLFFLNVRHPGLMSNRYPHNPEFERWIRRFHGSPGIADCVELLKRRNVQGEWIDFLCYEIENCAKQHPQDLIDAICDPENIGIRLILLGPLEDAAVPEAIPLFAEILDSGDEQERQYAIRGLKKLNTKEARTLLCKVGEA